MNNRIMKVTIGDYADDGHGKSETHIVLLKGEDLSDEKLQKTYANNIELTGVNPFDFCSHYEESTMSDSEWRKIRGSGFNPNPELETISTAYGVENDDYMYPFLELLMWYATHNTENTWELIKYDELYGGFNSIIKETLKGNGYGLFY